jgi:hypothetical protein
VPALVKLSKNRSSLRCYQTANIYVYILSNRKRWVKEKTQSRGRFRLASFQSNSLLHRGKHVTGGLVPTFAKNAKVDWIREKARSTR